MMIYRYEFEDGEGFIQGLDRLSDDPNELDSFCADITLIFDRDLPCPDLETYATMLDEKIKSKSYFTEHGNNKFKKEIDAVLDRAKEKGIPIRSICISDSILDVNNLLYKDMFQVIYKI